MKLQFRYHTEREVKFNSTCDNKCTDTFLSRDLHLKCHQWLITTVNLVIKTMISLTSFSKMGLNDEFFKSISHYWPRWRWKMPMVKTTIWNIFYNGKLSLSYKKHFRWKMNRHAWTQKWLFAKAWFYIFLELQTPKIYHIWK